jgi:hypothetical protein
VEETRRTFNAERTQSAIMAKPSQPRRAGDVGRRLGSGKWSLVAQPERATMFGFVAIFEGINRFEGEKKADNSLKTQLLRFGFLTNCEAEDLADNQLLKSCYSRNWQRLRKWSAMGAIPDLNIS